MRGRQRLATLRAPLREEELRRAEPATPRVEERGSARLRPSEVVGDGAPERLEERLAADAAPDGLGPAAGHRHEARDEVAREADLPNRLIQGPREALALLR